MDATRARSEILGRQPNFFADVFSDKTPAVSEAIVGDDLIELVLAGAYPVEILPELTIIHPWHVEIRIDHVGTFSLAHREAFDDDAQIPEVAVGIKMLNRMIRAAKPISIRI